MTCFKSSTTHRNYCSHTLEQWTILVASRLVCETCGGCHHTLQASYNIPKRGRRTARTRKSKQCEGNVECEQAEGNNKIHTDEMHPRMQTIVTIECDRPTRAQLQQHIGDALVTKAHNHNATLLGGFRNIDRTDGPAACTPHGWNPRWSRVFRVHLSHR